ncbi:MAG: TIR domain-containing protein [Lachnospiraceae bacterium]|nr:TIR domain-containing protein [Lachnospiraceae bacterium]
MGLENVKYDAFISYRHCELDSFVSENLHKKLENFKLPKSVVKKKGLKKTKIERVFRDEAELPLSGNLSDPIMAALGNTEFLIVICTPRLPQSLWCKKEIETFVQTHDRNHVLLVLAEGEPDESFPEILLYEDVKEKDLNGNEVLIRRTREPLAADCRGKNNKERLKAMDNAVIKLCAAIFNLNYDDLKQRHREAQIKKRIIAMEAALAVVAVFAIVCILFTVKIQKQNKTIQDKYASSMAAASKELYENGRRLDAIYAARSVLPDRETKDYNEDAYRALVDAMNVYGASESYVPENIVTIPSSIITYRVSPDRQKMVLYGFDEKLYIADIKSGEILYEKDAPGLYDMDFSGNDGVIYSIGYNVDVCETGYIDINSKEEKTIDSFAGFVETLEDGSMTFTFTLEGVKGYVSDTVLYEIKFSDYGLEFDEFSEYLDVAFSEDGKYAVFAVKEDSAFDGAIVCRFETATGKIDMFIRDNNITGQTGLATSEDYVFIAFIGEDPDSYHDITHLLRYEVEYATSKSGVLGKIIEIGEMDDLCINDYGLCVYGNHQAMVFDYDINLLSTLARANEILEVFSCDDGFAIVDSSEKIFLMDSFFYEGRDMSYELFPNKSNVNLINVSKKGNALYIMHENDYSYVSEFELERGEFASVLSKTGVKEFTTDCVADKSAYYDKDKTVYTVLKSDDGKYYSIQHYNGALTIYDARTDRAVKSLYIDGLPNKFLYLKKQKSYVLYGGDSEYFFDKQFRFYTTIPYGLVRGLTDDKEEDIVLMNGQNEYFKVDLKSYGEIIDKSDEILGDYEPEQKIVDKYNITLKKRNWMHELKSIFGKSLENK